MNIRRGLFRTWLIVTILFIIGAATLSFEWVSAEFRKSSSTKIPEGFVSLIPVECGKARGNDYEKHSGNPYCWYALPKFRAAFPEYRHLADETLTERMYEKTGTKVESGNPWSVLLQATTIIFGVPLALLVLGSALLWASEGFVGKR